MCKMGAPDSNYINSNLQIAKPSIQQNTMLIRIMTNSAVVCIAVTILLQAIAKVESRVTAQPDPNSRNLLVFDSSQDRLLAAFAMATGAAACDMWVNMFFTFWGTAALKKDSPQVKGKSLVEWAFGWMLTRGAIMTSLSKMDMCGLGRLLMQREMKTEKKKIAADLGVEIRVCETSMQSPEIRREELIN